MYESSINELVMAIVKRKDREVSADLVSRINKVEENGQTALHYVIENGLYEIAELLIECGATLDLLDGNGLCPLHIATKKNNARIVSLILKKQPEVVNLKSREDNINLGFTAVHLACETVSLSDLLGVLLSCKDINLNQTDVSGRTAFHWAALKGSTGTLDRLLRAGAEPDLCDNDGKTPLVLAAQVGRPDVVRFLLENAKVRSNLKDTNGDYVLHHVAEVQLQRSIFNYQSTMNTPHIEVFFILIIKSDADLYAQNTDGDTILDLIVEPLAVIFEIIYRHKAKFSSTQSFDMFMRQSNSELLELGLPEEDISKLEYAKFDFLDQLPLAPACNYHARSAPIKRKFKKQPTNPDNTSSTTISTSSPIRGGQDDEVLFNSYKTKSSPSLLRYGVDSYPYHTNSCPIIFPSPNNNSGDLKQKEDENTKHLESTLSPSKQQIVQLGCISTHDLIFCIILYTFVVSAITSQISLVLFCN